MLTRSRCYLLHVHGAKAQTNLGSDTAGFLIPGNKRPALGAGVCLVPWSATLLQSVCSQARTLHIAGAPGGCQWPSLQPPAGLKATGHCVLRCTLTRAAGLQSDSPPLTPLYCINTLVNANNMTMEPPLPPALPFLPPVPPRHCYGGAPLTMSSSTPRHRWTRRRTLRRTAPGIAALA